jgi:hypothetical protein
MIRRIDEGRTAAMDRQNGSKWEARYLFGASTARPTPHIRPSTTYVLKTTARGSLAAPSQKHGLPHVRNWGNEVAGFSDFDGVAVITSTHSNTHGVHELSEKLLDEYVVPATVL